MYELALDHYYNHLVALAATARENPNVLDDGEFLPLYLAIYDLVRFMLVALDHLQEFAVSLADHQTVWDDLSRHDRAESQGLQVAIGLLKMKLIAALRANYNDCREMFGATTQVGLRNTASTETKTKQDVVMEPEAFLAHQEELLLSQVNHQLDLWPAILDRTGQLSERTAPCLFAPVHSPGCAVVRMEHYCFLQDCFFFDAGVSRVLNDLPDFDSDEGYSSD